MSEEQGRQVRGDRGRGQLSYRLGRLWDAAEVRRVPLHTIIVAIAAIALFYLAGKLVYRLRDVLLLLLVAGFIAMILNPVVLVLQKYVVRRRGLAVALVTVLALLMFLGLAVAFGYPLVNAITHLANELPSYVAKAEHGQGWIGGLVKRYHVQQWVTQNAPKLVTFGQDLSKPALAFGKGALSLLVELTTIFILVLLLLLEGPRLRRGFLALLSPGQAAEAQSVASEVNRAVVGYMFGNFLTSVICGLVVLVALAALGVPFPELWALWVALVDFLPMIGGALAGIPVVLFAAAAKSLTAGVVTLVVFLIYTQIENHVLNPVIMSKTVRISPLLVLISVLVGASVGSWVGGLFGGFVAALLAIPVAGAVQVIVREAWRLTAPPPDAEAGEQALARAAGEEAGDAAGEGEEAGDAAGEGEEAGDAAGEAEQAQAADTAAPQAKAAVRSARVRVLPPESPVSADAAVTAARSAQSGPDLP